MDLRFSAAGIRNRLSTRHVMVGIVSVSLALAVLCGVTGSGIGIERMLSAWSAALRSHPASGDLHIVEVDAASIAAIDDWPWSHAEHAKVVDRLRAAGASVIAFDIDFSSRSSRTGDAALAAAIDRAAGRVILPTFRQRSNSRDAAEIDALPAPALRQNAALAAVSVLPDRDGAIREAPIGTVTDGMPRPSLSAMLAGRAGAAGASFPIDYAIDPTTIPRHSFIDIRDGRFDPAAVRGRQFLVGATAIELGDRYPIPNYGVVPGVIVQALAAETLARGVPYRIGWPVAVVIALLLSVGIVRARRSFDLAVVGVACPIILFLLAVGVQAAFGAVVALVPALLLLGCTLVATIASRLIFAWHARRLHDPVTGLPNRQALAALLRGTATGGVVVARIADFEKLASGLSTDATGQVMLRLADRIRLVSQDAQIYRINDRMLAWPATIAIDQAADRYATLRTLMLSPIEIGGRRIDVSLSIGIADSCAKDSEQTIANAALAAEQAHEAQSGWHLHTDAEGEAVDRDLSLLGELTEAVERGELTVHYQPKLDIASGRIASVEALVRWDHPTRGFLRPDLFIPLAERNDRIEGLTLAVIEQTIADLNGWAAHGNALTAAVNLSAKLLSSDSFNADLIALLHRTGVAPERLIFEVTESAAMVEPEAAQAALTRFREMGVAVSMDDYGTGQSTLSYLKRLPLTEVKIDRSFVQYAHQNRGDAILVRSTVDLAHELGLKVVAEGVEDEACLAFLSSINCDMAQGYLISRPVDANEITAMLSSKAAKVA
ncbi:EAL domain-containing protein [Roseomonas aeriglobus]|nr:EAL domain-containing protein [Roseomonas aeriglobus]